MFNTNPEPLKLHFMEVYCVQWMNEIFFPCCNDPFCGIPVRCLRGILNSNIVCILFMTAGNALLEGHLTRAALMWDDIHAGFI